MNTTRKILIVDDDPEDLVLIEEALLELGQDIHCEENGIEALKYLEYCNELPSLIILDLNMPKLNGTETLSKLKENQKFKHIPVVIYSTSINAFEKDKCLRLGAYSYIVKPVSYSDTINTAKYFSNLCDE